ncbi:MAG: arginase family protein [Thermoanaerobaculia bacterium]
MRISLLGAPTNLGNRPYESDGTGRRTTELPARLRTAGVVQRLGARDLGDVAAAPYRDFVRPPGGIRNEDLVEAHVRAIAHALAPVDDFSLVLAGDCSTLLGCLLALKRRGKAPALVYFDAHDDFNTPEISETGGAAGMDLALATGRGDTPLARLDPAAPLVREEDVLAVGLRDGSLDAFPIRRAATTHEITEWVGDREFFVHVDADVLDPEVMPWVDSPEAGGLRPEELTSMLAGLLAKPGALGLELTIYDPRDDADGRGARLLVDILANAFDRAGGA